MTELFFFLPELTNTEMRLCCLLENVGANKLGLRFTHRLASDGWYGNRGSFVSFCTKASTERRGSSVGVNLLLGGR